MSAPQSPGTEAGNSPSVPVNDVTRWLVALAMLRDDALFGLPARGVAQRIDDLVDDMRGTRHRITHGVVS